MGHAKKSVLKNQKGQSLIEYVILVALVGVATMGMIRVLQKTVNVNLANVVNALQGDAQGKMDHEKVESSDLKKKDFQDFMNGSIDKGK